VSSNGVSLVRKQKKTPHRCRGAVGIFAGSVGSALAEDEMGACSDFFHHYQADGILASSESLPDPFPSPLVFTFSQNTLRHQLDVIYHVT